MFTLYRREGRLARRGWADGGGLARDGRASPSLTKAVTKITV